MSRLDIRLRSLLLTVVFMVLVAAVVQLLPVNDAANVNRSTADDSSDDDQVQRHFDWAVAQLRQRRFELAINGFLAVLEQVPAMPEAWLNIGYARLELQQYQQAADSFTRAIDLRPEQFNAYWGLAVSLEGLCDIPAAIGAMRTYVHLAPVDDPFLTKANAAIWEWEQIRTRQDNGKYPSPCGNIAVTREDNA